MNQTTVKLSYLKMFAPFASKDDPRLAIQCVRVEFAKIGTIYTATDGHRMVAAIDRRFRAKKKADRFTVSVPLDICRKLPRGSADDDAILVVRGAVLELKFGDEVVRGAPLDMEYPNWRKVPQSVRTLSGKPAQFNPDYVKSFSLLAKQVGIEPAVVCHNGPSDCCPIVFSDTNVIGYLMPVRLEARYRCPDWCEP